MSAWVLDASVVIKWFVPEALSMESRRWRRVGGALHAPTLLDTELANILWKKVGWNDLTRSQADRILTRLPWLPLTRHPDAAAAVTRRPTRRLWPAGTAVSPSTASSSRSRSVGMEWR